MELAAEAISGHPARHRALIALRAAPSVVLVLSAAVIVATSPGGHFGLALAVVPFLAAAVHGVQATALIGALTVGTYAGLRHWQSEDDTDVWLIKLGLMAATAAVAVLISQARVRELALNRSRDTALTLQRGLLPRDFPATSAAEIRYRYVPADTAAGVGGDWFDVIPLSGARVALVMGDVVGHGLHAAATMGRLRTAVHTLADLDLPPDEVLARMDDLVVRMGHDEVGREPGASCLYMVYDPVAGTCTMGNAGHTPPAFVSPDGRVEVQPQAQNPPLGYGSAPFAPVEVSLPEGTVIALYTDGLLDLRHREADDAVAALTALLGGGSPSHSRYGNPNDNSDHSRLPGARGAHEPAGPGPGADSLERMCDRVYAALPPEHDDDAALMLARTRVLDADHVADWHLSGQPEEVAAARSALVGRMEEWGLGELAFTMELVVSELVTNAVQHAAAPVGLRLILDDALVCEVSDASSTSPHPRRAEPWEESGRGLFLVGQLADRWGTRYTPTGKTIWAEKYL
ncbi:ATP-binding SpoIIE family protein phosphatase [Actinacidiphila guanduensis]|uniref:Histidine kinase-like ATPase domain-containing protein n=1 Tax=Actinacidiphila guanduensis TaxID=310781 RepID=A0A1H0C9I4_9ACTN|nr:ATP-binding SpoIIE family protein phosphatase [Actinacidiphila guanduensis]SDN54493.1 Histidine kinase-like ATPase domain-containing protein [Actinacidiphila guanduensis]